MIQQVSILQTGVSKLSEQLEVVTEELVDLKEIPEAPKTSDLLSVGSVMDPAWKSEDACNLLKDATGFPWTAPKLLNVAMHKGWRSYNQGHDPIANLYCTRVTNRFNPSGTIVYTGRALQSIIDNPQEAWQLASSKSQVTR